VNFLIPKIHGSKVNFTERITLIQKELMGSETFCTKKKIF